MNDTTKVVLEVQSETSKRCDDAKPCSIRDLIHEMEEEGIVDTTLHHHSCERPEDLESGSGPLTQKTVQCRHVVLEIANHRVIA